VVDRVIGQREVVVRAITAPLISVPGVTGATELGDGRAVLILDASALIRARQGSVDESIRSRKYLDNGGKNSRQNLVLSGSQETPVMRGKDPGDIKKLKGEQKPTDEMRGSDMQENNSNSEPFILFELAGTTYALRSSVVQQMEMLEHITPVPNAPAYIEGVVFSRGKVIPALNLRTRFGFEKIPFDLRTRVIIVNMGDRSVGFIVDTAREFVSIPTDLIQPLNEAITGLSGEYLEGVAKMGERLILILNLGGVTDFVEPSQLPAINRQQTAIANFNEEKR